jgi:hypothetical protein
MGMDEGLIAHWPLTGDAKEASGADLCSVASGVTFGEVDGRTAGQFNGKTSGIEVSDHAKLQSGSGDFSVALWLHSTSDDIVGDLVNKFDHDTRNGFNLQVQTQTGTTQTTQPNYRHLQFGMDNARLDDSWTNCGQPGNAVMITCMATIQGSLYAGTFENAVDHVGHLWRYLGGQNWEDLGGAPPKCNCINSITYHKGDIYVSTGRYDCNGSYLGDPKNTTPGGNVYRIEDGKWIDCGNPGAKGAKLDDGPIEFNIVHNDKADDTHCLTSFRGEMFAASHHRYGVYKYMGDQSWKLIGPEMRIMSIAIHQNELYALINGGGVYRYDGDNDWTYCGSPQRSTQTYCGTTYRGQLHVGTWPECEIVRYEGGEDWTIVGRIGYEREVMAVAVYNGKCYFGTLPMANVFRMDNNEFTYVGNVDNEPNHFLRRAWSMAIYEGRMYVGTLPSGLVQSLQAGCMATHDHTLLPGWRHIVAAREGSALKLYLDGVLVSSLKANGDFNLNNDQPLRMGYGVGHVLNGALSDVRIYDRALEADEITQLISM